MKKHHYFVYILTDRNRNTLYIGMTNDLETRLLQHYDQRGNKQSFTGRYHCYYLLYYEEFQYVNHAIEREKELKKWRRAKKVALINVNNPSWWFLNEEIFGEWPVIR